MITALYAGILGLFYVALSIHVIQGRFKYRVSVGDGGSKAMQRRIRLHGNFIEYTPLALILMILVEQANYSAVLVHGLAMVLVVGRLFHIYGFATKEGPSVARAGGMAMTFGVILTASVLCIFSYL